MRRYALECKETGRVLFKDENTPATFEYASEADDYRRTKEGDFEVIQVDFVVNRTQAPLTNGVHCPRLREDICGREKMPKSFEFTGDKRLYDRRGNYLGTYKVVVLTGGSGSVHRLHMECPECRTLVPVGRIHQHIYSGICRERSDDARSTRGNVLSEVSSS